MDFRNCLEPNNLTIYAANFVGGTKDTAYAICSSVLTSITFTSPSGEQLVRWELAESKLINNITLNPPFEVFTINRPGAYLINYNTQASGSDTGSQLSIEFVINGTAVFANVFYPSGSPQTQTLTGTYPLVVTEGTPATVAIKVKYSFGTGSGAEFRYDQISIVPLDN